MAETFTRGSAVLSYWLTRPEGMTVQPLGARVERAVGPVPFGPAEALVVRGRNGRERTIPADRIVAVAPHAEELYLAGDDESADNAGARVFTWLAPRVSAGCRSLAARRPSRAG